MEAKEGVQPHGRIPEARAEFWQRRAVNGVSAKIHREYLTRFPLRLISG